MRNFNFCEMRNSTFGKWDIQFLRNLTILIGKLVILLENNKFGLWKIRNLIYGKWEINFSRNEKFNLLEIYGGWGLHAV